MKHGAKDADAERRGWTIERLVPGGDGMAHLGDGRVAFVTGAFPGERIQPIAVEARKGHVRATRWKVEFPSADRVEPPCPIAQRCGGCDWMALARNRQVAEKESLLRAALERVARVELPREIRMTTVGPDDHYRNRVRLHVSGAGKIGFYARGSQELVEVPACLVCHPAIDAALAMLRRLPASVVAPFREIDVRVSEPPLVVTLFCTARVPGAAPRAARAALSGLPEPYHASLDDGGNDAGAVQGYPLPGGVELLALPGVFTQVNWPVNVAMVSAVVAGARERRVARFCDGYAGAGNFSLPLAAGGASGVAIERDGRAVSCSRRAAQTQGLADRLVFVTGDAGKELRELARRGETFDLVLLDPPRKGAREAMDSVGRLAPRHVALCSCDPVTLARDVASLGAAGYRLDSVQGFDMFPHTHHLEALAWMSRRAASGPA